MAKYVCDTDAVKAIGESVTKTANDMNTSLDTYAADMNSHISGWSGSAKNSFSQSNDTQIAQTKADATEVQLLGEFIKSAAEAIEQLETELAGLSI